MLSACLRVCVSACLRVCTSVYCVSISVSRVRHLGTLGTCYYKLLLFIAIINNKNKKYNYFIVIYSHQRDKVFSCWLRLSDY